ncbi:CRISPR-associated protein Cas1 [Halarchaeum rubridurum]|uniref:CRISPR-associated endonuclease Cas1 n=1 Tax=Halarchaeum rubridurum TaxID=489911 RepID=A0A830FLR4_9EURY|nr:CRISPR-associated endonuclease Cas1 [Halarchaeum rubridurum]MBP1954664.1 CRISPR-associated protein Cas1 [Halarchaeum rubridurum]GGM62864.1 CRISPR-associated endonuclease Cas1 [Halarchaeum rubridurum]
MKASQGMFDDSVVYVTTQGSQVRIDGGQVVIYDVEGDDGELASFPVEKLDTINVFGGVNFSTPFVATANEHGIVLNYFTQNGQYRGSFVPERNTIAEVRRAQYALDDGSELTIAKAMIAAKVRNARTILSRKGVRGTTVLKDLGERVSTASNKDDLRGVEGEAAERYFDRLDETLVDDWTFETRSKRPPEDHINSLLSLTYVMMKNEVLSALRCYNLDPFLGVLHADRHGRPSLALDLQEEFRPLFCDAFVTRLVNRGTITHDQFGDDNRLTDDGFRAYLDKFDDYMTEELTHPHFDYRVSRRKAIRQQVILLRKAITGELDDYHALEVSR